MSTYEIWNDGTDSVKCQPWCVWEKYNSAEEAFAKIDTYGEKYRSHLYVVEVSRQLVKRPTVFTRDAGWIPTQSTGFPRAYWRTHFYAENSQVSLCGRKTNGSGQPGDKAWDGVNMKCALCAKTVREEWV